MLLAPSVSGLFKWREFEPEIILLAVGWCLRFSLSYRDVEELLAERGVHADHVTVWRTPLGTNNAPLTRKNHKVCLKHMNNTL
jgi:transposase-like protein